MKGFLRMAFCPKFLPPVVMPFYWLFLVCFYPFYGLIYFFIWAFSPHKDKKSRLKPYLEKPSRKKRDLTLTPETKPDDSGNREGKANA